MRINSRILSSVFPLNCVCACLIRVYLGFLLLSLRFYIFTIVLVYLYTSTLSIMIKSIL